MTGLYIVIYLTNRFLMLDMNNNDDDAFAIPQIHLQKNRTYAKHHLSPTTAQQSSKPSKASSANAKPWA
jgi:hypothetical protein